jgi:hypothetical protein
MVVEGAEYASDPVGVLLDAVELVTANGGGGDWSNRSKRLFIISRFSVPVYESRG